MNFIIFCLLLYIAWRVVRFESMLTKYHEQRLQRIEAELRAYRRYLGHEVPESIPEDPPGEKK